MDKRDDAELESRRKFMKSMALTGGGVALVAKVGLASASEAELDESPASGPTGYHETQHIRDYYAKANF